MRKDFYEISNTKRQKWNGFKNRKFLHSNISHLFTTQTQIDCPIEADMFKILKFLG